jgi:hypothetical protein
MATSHATFVAVDKVSALYETKNREDFNESTRSGHEV